MPENGGGRPAGRRVRTLSLLITGSRHNFNRCCNNISPAPRPARPPTSPSPAIYLLPPPCPALPPRLLTLRLLRLVSPDDTSLNCNLPRNNAAFDMIDNEDNCNTPGRRRPSLSPSPPPRRSRDRSGAEFYLLVHCCMWWSIWGNISNFANVYALNFQNCRCLALSCKS